MNKFFIVAYLCLGICLNLQAKTTEIIDKSSIPLPQTNKNSNGKINQISSDMLEDMLSERIDETFIQKEANVSSKMTDIYSFGQLLEEQEKKAPNIFKQIYDNAIRRISNEPQIAEEIEYQKQTSQNYSNQQQEWHNINFPVIKTMLPYENQETLIPAKEHIPYMMTNIEILPTGTTKISEIITVLANGEKVKKSLSRILPKYVSSRKGDKQKITYNLIKVSIDEQEIPYKQVELNNNIVFTPLQNNPLQAGIYTYKFEYLANNLIINYDDFKEFYWNINTNLENLVVAKAGATLKLPDNIDPIGQEAFIAGNGQIDNSNTLIINPAKYNWGYASQRPLFSNEKMYILLSLPKTVTDKVTWSQKWWRNFSDYYDIYISGITLILILISLMISWKFIRADKGQIHIKLKKSAEIVRFLAYNRYDIKSFAGFLLDLYRKNIIDIQQSDDTILLVKRTDDYSSLDSHEKKALNHLFDKGDPVLNANSNNRLKITRAVKEIKKGLNEYIFKFLLKLNSGYLFLSIAMLAMGELFIGLASINQYNTIKFLLIATVLMIIALYIWGIATRKIWSNILLKIVSVFMILTSILIMYSSVSLTCIVFILLSLVIIKYSTSIYVQKTGLMKTYIEQVASLKQNIKNNREIILIGREIVNKQATILALDLEDDFINSQNQEINKLKTMKLFIDRFKKSK